MNPLPTACSVLFRGVTGTHQDHQKRKTDFSQVRPWENVSTDCHVLLGQDLPAHLVGGEGLTTI